MATNNFAAGQVPRRRPPPPPPRNRVQEQPSRPLRPPPPPKPLPLRETVFELPAETVTAEDDPFEVAAPPLSVESQFDEQLEHTYVAYSRREIPNEDNIIEDQFESSDSLERPLPAISLYVCYSLFFQD